MKIQNNIWLLPGGDLKIKTAVWIIIMGLVLQSCENFVEVDVPTNQLLTPAVFEEKATAHAAMTDIYAKIRDNGLLTGGPTGISVTLGLYTDELRYHGSPANTAVNYFNNTLLPTGLDIATYWNNSYNQIYASNSVIAGVRNAIRLSQVDREQLTGEALFVRALVHSYLTGVFGSIPYVTTTELSTNSDISKITTDEVYALAIADLEEALPLLPEQYATTYRVRPNRFAAQALLARLYLYAGRYSEAADAASAVLDQTGLYNMQSDLTLTFKKESPATIWQLSPKAVNGNTLQASVFIFVSPPPTFVSLTTSQMEAFETGDLRKTNWTKTLTNANGAWHHAFKYRQRTASTPTVEMSIVLRLSEVYLIRAEARARAGELNSAIQDVNVIRTTAGLPEANLTTQSQILNAILQERRVELFSEYGHRFFDLKRFDTIDESLTDKTGWESTDRLFPLPQSELNLNTNLLPQNSGY